jgi:hypothetical protein
MVAGDIGSKKHGLLMHDLCQTSASIHRTRSILHGLPAAKTSCGTSVVTTEQAPMTASERQS